MVFNAPMLHSIFLTGVRRTAWAELIYGETWNDDDHCSTEKGEKKAEKKQSCQKEVTKKKQPTAKQQQQRL